MLRELASTFHSSTQRKSFSKGNKPSSNPKPKTPSYSLHQKSLSTSLFQTISPPHQDQQQPLQSPSSNTIQLPFSSLSPHNQSSKSSKLIRNTSHSNLRSTYNDVDALRSLEAMIGNINTKGFKRFESTFIEKQRQKNLLLKSIENLKKKIHSHNNNNKLRNSNERKQCIQVENVQKRSKNCKDYNEELNDVKRELVMLKPKINEIKYETVLINGDIIEHKNTIIKLKDKIQKVNNDISKLNKDKDNYRLTMAMLIKHIETLKSKINNLNNDKNTFLQNVRSLTLNIDH